MTENKSIVLKVLKILCIVILSLILVLNIFVMIQAKANPNKVPSVFGYKQFIVLSGSMESKIEVGDLVFVKEIDVDKLKVDDIIAFRDKDNLVTTHRIIKEVNTDHGRCFETKGDNNNTKDENVVCASAIEGKYSKKISKVGSIILFIQQPLGFMIMMLTILIICMFIYFVSNKKINSQISAEKLKEFEEFKKEKAKRHKQTQTKERSKTKK